MPDLIHTFTGGKMNKDLDERLVPNGEYRDALNLEIASTATSHKGAFQNIKGNIKKAYSSYNESTQTWTTWDDSVFIDSLNGECIGSVAEENGDNVYWFIASENISVIAGYNQTTQVTFPLIVDTQNILNFKSEYHITGINVLEGMLIWTDDQTEPKKIVINDWLNSTPDFVTHSQIYGRDFIEADITVIKKYPLEPPIITTYNTTRAVESTGQVANVQTTCLFSFVEQPAGSPLGTIVPKNPESGPQTIMWMGATPPYYKPGDYLLFEWTGNNPLDTDALIRCEVISIIGGVDNQQGAVVTVLTVGPGGQNNTLDPQPFNVTLEDETPLFEFVFASFAYRYKYKNNEVSAFSAFSMPAFIPGGFDYSPRQGYNLGMVNNTRQLAISNFIPTDIPDDVVEVDILYKSSNNQNVYVVDSFKPNDEEWVNNTFNIQNEIITAAVQSNQILRPYDNVPRWAKAQEITANRLIYGNYTQNFNILDANLDPLQIGIDVISDARVITTNTDDNGDPLGVSLFNEVVYPSIKTIRTYQLGVAYQDEYGRTTPVFTSNNASVELLKDDAQFANQLGVQLTNATPYYDQNKPFSTFKYYVKETSQEYYNLALDRYYNAEDGNVWLSFPSAERNKVDEETFLILKKEHDNSNPVTEQARYKIIAIENEAPVELKETRLSKGLLPTEFEPGGFPIEGTNEFWVEKDDFDDTFGENARSTSGLEARVVRGTQISEWYNISTFAEVSPGGTDYIRITVSKTFGPDMNFTSTQPYGYTNRVDGLYLELAEVEIQNKPEFTGRFFVKVNEDALLTEKIVGAFEKDATNYIRKAFSPLYRWNRSGTMNTQSEIEAFRYPPDSQGNTNRLFIDEVKFGCGSSGDSSFEFNGELIKPDTTNRGRGVDEVENLMMISWIGGYGNFAKKEGSIQDSNPALLQQLNQSGTLFRFIDAGNGLYDPNGTVYQVTSTMQGLGTSYDCNPDDWFDTESDEWSNQVARWTLTFVEIESGWKGLQWNPVTDGGVTSWNNNNPTASTAYTGIEFISYNPSDNKFSTNNPAIFETEPKEATELDIYYEIPGNYDVATEHGDLHMLDWFNCYSFGNGVESDRIRDDFNAATIGNGVKASATLDEPYEQETRMNGLIFSQIFNSISGLNGLNQFIQAESITKDVNPEYGGIQKLFTRDTNLVTLCENKSMKILANKDALFNADGSANVTSNKAVLGQTVTFAGEFGIGTNPESFAEFGFRMYYTDANAGTVVRLSNDGITEISSYGMHEFFQANLIQNNKLIGGWDPNQRNYDLTLNTLTPYWQQTLGAGYTDRLNLDPSCDAYVNTWPTTSTTISFKEDVNGWTSRKVYTPESSSYLNGIYYTFKDGNIWEHNANPLYNTWYGIGPQDMKLGAYYESSFTALFNEQPEIVKEFKTVNYSGTKSREYIYTTGGVKTYTLAELQAQQLIPTTMTLSPGWYTNSLVTDLQEGQVKDFLNKEGKYFNYIKGLPTFYKDNCDNNVNSHEFNVQGIGRATVSGDIDPTEYFITTELDPDCFTEQQALELLDQNYVIEEDVAGTFTISQTNTCAGTISWILIGDNTTGGSITNFDTTTGEFTFTPDLNYNGPGGTFLVQVCCDNICSNTATMTITVEPVPEAPYFVSSPPSLDGLLPGDCWSYSPIIVADPDHAATDLTVLALQNTVNASWINDPTQILDAQGNPTGEWEITTSCVPAGTPASNISFTLVVQDPDNPPNEGTQEVQGATVVEALLALEFVITARPGQQARSWTNPTTGQVTELSSQQATTHFCNGGTYLITGNGVNIGRAYVGNKGINSDGVTLENNTRARTSGYDELYLQFDSYEWEPTAENIMDYNNGPTNPTGDVEGLNPIPSAIAQGVTTTLLTQATASNFKYINSTDTFTPPYGTQTWGQTAKVDRYNILSLNVDQAQEIANNTSNDGVVTFGLVADTWAWHGPGIGWTTGCDDQGGQCVTHSDAVIMQIFKDGVEIYSAAQPAGAAISINVLTGQVV